MVARPEDLSIAQRAFGILKAKTTVASQPENSSAYYNLAELLSADGQHTEALEHLKTAHELAPDDIEIIILLAEVSIAAGLLTQARKYAELLTEKAPNDLNYRMFYGDVLMRMGKPDLAVKHYRYVLGHRPDNPEVLGRIGQAEQMMGKAEGIASIRKSLEAVDPLNASVIYSEAFNRKNSPAQSALMDEKIEKALEQTTEKESIANLYYSRGKIFDDVGEFDKAFEAYKAANEVLGISGPETDKAIFTNMKTTFNRGFLFSKADGNANSSGPIFILGMPRSGTTLVESICATHSRITAGDELPYISNIAKGLKDANPDPDAFKVAMDRLTGTEIENLTKLYMGETAQYRTETPFSTDKLPHNFLRLGIISMLLPTAPVIHCRRHPIDTCLSIYTNSMSKFHYKYKSDLTRLGLYYRQYWELMQHWRENIPGGFHEVFYEDVVANTELNGRKMIDYIGLEWENTVKDRQTSQKSVKTVSAWQVRQPVYASSSGRWKNYEMHLGPLIDALGPVVDDYENALKSLA